MSMLHFQTEHYNHMASKLLYIYSGGPRLKIAACTPTIPTGFVWFSSFPLGKCQDCTLISSPIILPFAITCLSYRQHD